MFRNEKELLNSLVKILSGETTQTNKITDIENETIEKYRDKDGFINLTNVKDKSEVKKIVEMVDKKNYLESLQTNNTKLDANKLAEELFTMLGVDDIDINISTPNNTNSYHFSKEKDSCGCGTNCCKTEDTIKEKCCEKESSTEEKCCEPKENTNTLRSVVLYNVGGNYNPAFYNAVLHICENEYFKDEGVYSEFDIHPDKVDACILLPNIWNKMLLDAVEDFVEDFKNGTEVYVIHPETFELTQITDSTELWDYAMSEIQKEYL